MKNIFKISFLASIMLLFMNSCTKEQVESASQLSDTEVSLRSTLGCDGGNTVPAPVFIYNMYEDPITGECCFQLRFATAYYGMQWEIWSYNDGTTTYPSNWTIVPYFKGTADANGSNEICLPDNTEIIIQFTDPNHPTAPNYVWACHDEIIDCK